jgi:hypothetical protein
VSLVDGGTSYDLTCARLVCLVGFTAGSSTIILTGFGTLPLFYINIPASFSAGTSLIKITAELTSDVIFGNKNATEAVSLNNFWNDSSGDYYIKFEGPTTFNDLKLSPGRKQSFEAGEIFTVTTFTAEGTSGDRIELTSSSTSVANLVKSGGGTIEVENCDISYLSVTPSDTWYAYRKDGNINRGNNIGWEFVTIGSKYPLPAFMRS